MAASLGIRATSILYLVITCAIGCLWFLAGPFSCLLFPSRGVVIFRHHRIANGTSRFVHKSGFWRFFGMSFFSTKVRFSEAENFWLAPGEPPGGEARAADASRGGARVRAASLDSQAITAS